MHVSVSSAYGAVMAADQTIMRRLQHWRAPRWLQWWMIAATRCGDGWLWGLYALAILGTDSSATRFSALAAAGLAVTAGILLFRFLKRRVGRRRPCQLQAHCWAKLLPPDQ